MVSVIVPAYNMEKYLGRCLDALISQSYQDLEIIVINDGSLDKTCEIAMEYAGRDDRIKAITKENGGVSSARNLGIENASGEYIYFFDPDDLIETDGIENLVKAMTESGVDLVACQYSRWNDNGTRLEDYDFITGKRTFSTEKDRISFILNELLDYHVGYEVWNKLFKASIIREKKIRFSEECRIGEDLAFNIKYLMNIKDVDNIPERCVRYNIRNDSAMGGHTNLSVKLSENALLLKDVLDYADEIHEEAVLDNKVPVFIKAMEKAYVGHTPLEIIDAYKNIGDISFIQSVYADFEEKKKEVLAMYPEDIANIKYRYHMLVKAGICGDLVGERVKRKIYNLYRRLRGREILENWKMPY